MTNNNQNYERPELQVLFVETESGFANSPGIPNFDQDNTSDDSDAWGF